MTPETLAPVIWVVAEATATYLTADLTPKALGTTLTIPAYAATLTALANNGADALYTGPIAQYR